MIIVKPDKGQDGLYTRIEFEQLRVNPLPGTNSFDNSFNYSYEYQFEHFDMNPNNQNPISSLNSLGSNRSSSTLPSLSRTPSSASVRPSSSRLDSDSTGPSSLTSGRSPGPQTLYTDYKVGDYVYVDSRSGVRFGVIRYAGYVQFAPGYWFGIELSDPLGKNNGSIEGKTYFKCEDNHGIFTQAAKISKSPPIKKGKRPNALGAIGSTFGSKESLSSMSLSASRRHGLGASQESLQSCISGVSAITGVFKQAPKDRAAARSGALEEANQARMKSERALFERQQELAQLKIDYEQEKLRLNELQNQLEEEKRKSETLEFRLEEETVARMHLDEELQKLSITSAVQTQSLPVSSNEQDKSLKEEENEMEVFQLQEELIKKEESLLQIENSLKSKSLENSNLLERLREFEQTLKVYEQRQTNHLSTIDELNLKLKKHEQLQLQMQENAQKSKSEQIDATVQALQEQLERKKEELIYLQQQLKESNDQLKSISNEKQQTLVQLQTMQSKVQGQQQSLESLGGLQSQLDQQNHELSQLKLRLVTLERDVLERDETIERQTRELNESWTLKSNLETKLADLNEKLIEGQTALDKLEKELLEKDQTIERLNKNQQNAQSQSMSEQNQLQVALNHADGKVRQLQSQSEQQKNELKLQREQLSKLEAEIRAQFEQNERFKHEISEYQQKLKEKENDLIRCEEELVHWKEDANKQQNAKQALEQQVKILKSELNSKEESLHDFNRKKLQFQNEMEQLIRELNQTKEIKIQLEGKQAEWNQSKLNLEQIQHNLEQHIRNLEVANRELEENVNRLNESNLTLTQEKKHMEKALGESENNQTNVICNLEQQLKCESNRCNQLEIELNQMREAHDNEIQSIRTRHVEMMNEFEADVIKLEDKINQMTESLRLKDELINELEVRNERQTDQLRSNYEQERNELIAQIGLLEQNLEKNQAIVDEALNKRINNHFVSQSLGSTSTNDPSEDCDIHESQIKFLNSVIVDMQMKNDELKSRLQMLEEIRMSEMQQLARSALEESNDFNAQSSDSSRFRFRPVQKVNTGSQEAAYANVHTKTVRLFCDECDLFDVHDTEDCPKLSKRNHSDLLAPEVPKKTNKHTNRAYCARCERFEHWTYECEMSANI